MGEMAEFGLRYAPRDYSDPYYGRDDCGIRYHNNRHELHRKDGPALIRTNGTQEWYKNGKLHRPSSEGPAIIKCNGTIEYWENNKRHRPMSEGPAVIKANGKVEYWENGRKLPNNNQQSYLKMVSKQIANGTYRVQSVGLLWLDTK